MLSPDQETMLRELVGDTLSEEEIAKLVRELTDVEFKRRIDRLHGDIFPANPPRFQRRRRP